MEKFWVEKIKLEREIILKPHFDEGEEPTPEEYEKIGKQCEEFLKHYDYTWNSGRNEFLKHYDK